MHSHLLSAIRVGVGRRRWTSAIVFAVLTMVLGVVPGRSLAQPSDSTSQGVNAPRLHVVVTIPPLVGLVKPLLPVGSDVKLLMPPGRSEHGYEFTPSDLAAVAKADVLIYVGLGLEPRIEKEVKERPVPGRVVVSMSEALGIQAPEGGHDHPEHADHEHGPACDHGPVDQHLWLDPRLVEEFVPRLASAITSAFTQAGAEAIVAMQVDDAARRLVDEVRRLHADHVERLAPLKGRAIVTHHNAFARLADRYGLVVADSIREFDNSDPTPKEVEQIIRTIRDRGVTTIFVEPNYNAKIAERLAKAAKVKLGRLDPLGDGDWFKMMRGNLDQLVTNLTTGEK